MISVSLRIILLAAGIACLPAPASAQDAGPPAAAAPASSDLQTQAPRPAASPVPASDTTPSGAERRRELIDKLVEWERWYEGQSNLYGGIWNTFTIAAIVLAALTSLFAALGKGEDWKLAMIVMPALAALLTTLIVQFRVRENWKLREIGRLELAELVNEARTLSENDPEIRVKSRELVRKALTIDRAQATAFFETLTANGRIGADAGKPSDTGGSAR
ncbi:MAG: DUF4231 domain-containing protein [Methylobacteriaceae bacterium]|nr:DUF4231 domain-containing protein [Methylobacteriaceae bacterium]